MTKALALEEVTFGYGREPILDRLTLSIDEGEIVALLGPSGGGKSTVLRLLLGFATPASGRVEIGGTLVSSDGAMLVPPEDRNLAVVFQDLALWPHLTVRGNLAFGLDSRRVARAVQAERIREVLGRVGLAEREHSHPGELSGGERQRAAIARALVLEPRAILLDEPLANLDAHRKRRLIGMFREIFKERKTTALYVTHDLREAATLADRIAVLENGHVVQHGTLDELRARPATEFVDALITDLIWTGPQ